MKVETFCCTLRWKESRLVVVVGAVLVSLQRPPTPFTLESGLLDSLQVVNIVTNRCVRVIGKNETIRVLSVALYQGYFCGTLLSFLHEFCFFSAAQKNLAYLLNCRKTQKDGRCHLDH